MSMDEDLEGYLQILDDLQQKFGLEKQVVEEILNELDYIFLLEHFNKTRTVNAISQSNR